VSKGVVVYAKVIDPDYRGNSTVLLYNSTSTAHTVKVGNRIVQLIVHNISTPVLLKEDQLDSTKRLEQGFSSTGMNTTDALQINRAVDSTPYLQPADMPYNIFLSSNPFVDVITITVKDFGMHDTMGRTLQQCALHNRPKLTNIIPSQPCSHSKKWRSTIKHGYITQIEEYTINNIEDVKTTIRSSWAKQLEYMNMEVALDIKPSGIHPVESILQLFSDQLYVMQQHLQTIQNQYNSATLASTATQKPQIHNLDLIVDDHLVAKEAHH